MKIENENQLDGLKSIGKIVANCLAHMAASVRPGISTKELDSIGQAFLTNHGAKSAPILMYNFPGWTCISVNEEMAHGIPGSRILEEGDLVNIDVSAELNGLFADTGGSFPVGTISQEKQDVCRATKAALDAAILVATAGNNLNEIGRAIEGVAAKNKLSVVRDLGSHGVGLSLHEEPKFIPSFYDQANKSVLEKDMVITIEPFLTTGLPFSKQSEDGWTLSNVPGAITAQYEHSMVITEGQPIILTSPDPI